MNEGRNMVLQVKMLSGRVIYLENENARLKDSLSRYKEKEAEEDVLAENYAAALKESAELREELKKVREERDKLKAVHEMDEKEKESLKVELATARNCVREAGETIRNMHEQLERRTEEQKAADDVISKCKRENVDFHSVVRLLQLRIFNKNSDRATFLNGDLELDQRLVDELGLDLYIKKLLHDADQTDIVAEQDSKVKTGEEACKEAGLDLAPKKRKKKSQKGVSKPTFTYAAKILEKYGIDMSNIRGKAKLIKGKDEDGNECWYVRLVEVIPAQTKMLMCKVGHFNVQGSSPQTSKYPKQIVKNCPMTPSLFRFYTEMKNRYGVPEEDMLKMLKSMGFVVAQSTFNSWAHTIMGYLRELLEPHMINVVRKAHFTHNDGTRLTVRSRKSRDEKFKYRTEMIQAVLAPLEKIIVMLYEEGSRSHEVQEDTVFRDSEIRAFMADRYAGYGAIVKDLQECHIERAACWAHFHHYLADSYVSDHRMGSLITLTNVLFLLEQRNEGLSPEEIQTNRTRYSMPIVNKIVEKLKLIRNAGNEYGQLVHRAVDYLLDDEEAYRRYLWNPLIPISNNSIERCFRLIAKGRHQWQQIGSHVAAKNLTFMFSLVESCKLNNLDFGEYIEDVLNRIIEGRDENGNLTIDVNTLIPCYYQPSLKIEKPIFVPKYLKEA